MTRGLNRSLIATLFAASALAAVRAATPAGSSAPSPVLARFLSLADFVHRFGDRAGDRQFRFDVGGHELFVFAEKRPLAVSAEAALAPVAYAPLPSPFRLPNARARLEREALEICERYRRTHAGVRVFYEDADVRIYNIRH